MNIFKFKIKTILHLFFVTIFFSTLQAKNLDKFSHGSRISNYFSGILLLEDNQYDKSYKFLKELDGLEEIHLNFSSKYLFSLINSGKFTEAFNYSKKLEKKNLGNFESDLITGVYYLKNNNYDQAHTYFLRLQKRKSKFIINDFISSSLINWTSFKDLDLPQAQDKIDNINSRFQNLKEIQNVFLHCFYSSNKTEFYFKDLISNENIDFSRYDYFYASYLNSIGKNEEAKRSVNSSLKLYPENLLLNQYRLNLDNKKNDKTFNCQYLPHVIAEILYITANALSTQNIYTISNFYLNLSKYLNKNFHSFDILLAENFYKINNLKEAKNIYTNIGKKGKAYYWYASKHNSRILIKEKKKEKALKFLSNAYEILKYKNVYMKYDYAKFLKSNDQFEKSIKYYTEILNEIDKDHPLYPKSTDGRGVAYERIGKWEKAEKDLLSSLKAKPDQAYVINYLAYSWIEKGIKIDKSLKMLEKANRLEMNDPFIIDSLGWALFKLKRYDDSKNYLQQAVKLMPADPIINDHYGDVLWKNGKKIQARYYWNYVLRLNETEKNLKDKIKIKLIIGL